MNDSHTASSPLSSTRNTEHYSVALTDTQMSTVKTLFAEQLTPEAFKPFGEVVSHQGPDRRHFLSEPFENNVGSSSPRIWVSKLKDGVVSPVRATYLERHLHSSQTFIPLSQTSTLILVAPRTQNNSPDPDKIKAFVARPDQGVCYRSGVWHYGLSPISSDGEYVVIMSTRNDGTDDEFVDLQIPVLVHFENP